MRTLTETLMEEEARYSSSLCYKTASSYMFGAEMSSGFGSSRGGGGSGCGSSRDFMFGFDVPSVVEACKDMGRSSLVSSNDCGYSDGRYSITGNENGFKIFSNEGGAPLMRLDIDSHHNMPKNHLQLGKKEYFGRHGEEAVDIFASVFVNNPKIKFPWEK